MLLELRERLDRLEIPKSPFTKGTGLPRAAPTLISSRGPTPRSSAAGALAGSRSAGALGSPEIVVQVAFIEWTPNDKLRHPRLLGVRADKAARDVIREHPREARSRRARRERWRDDAARELMHGMNERPQASVASRAAREGGAPRQEKSRITHPENPLPDDGITKGELAAYYDSVAPQMVPHMRARPVTMETISGRDRRGRVLPQGRLEGLSRVARSAPKCRRKAGRCIIRSSWTRARCCG